MRLTRLNIFDLLRIERWGIDEADFIRTTVWQSAVGVWLLLTHVDFIVIFDPLITGPSRDRAPCAIVYGLGQSTRDCPEPFTKISGSDGFDRRRFAIGG